MTITFDEVDSTHDVAAGVSARVFRTYGFTEALADGFGIHRRQFRAYGTAAAGALAIPDPEIPVIGLHARLYGGEGEPFSGTFDEGTHAREIGSFGFAGAPGDAAGFHRREFRGYGYASIEGGGYGLLVSQPFHLSSFASVFFESFNESIEAAQTTTSTPIYGLMTKFKLRGTPDDTLAGLSRVQDNIELSDVLSVVFRELLAEGFTIGGTVADNFRAVDRLMEALAFTGLATSQLEAGNILAASIAFAELLTSGFVESVSDSVAFEAASNDALTAAAVLIENLLASDTAEAAVRFTAVVEERLLVSDEAVSALSAVELLREGVTFAIHLNVHDGQYVAYSINTENKAVTEYTNYPYNSFARLPVPGGWRYLGMTPAGIRELEGTDDAGSAIAASFRLALTNLGSGQMKRMQAAYLGYTSTGELRLKAIIVAKDGKKEAWYYRLHAQPQAAPQQSRIKIGQGLRAVYWAFEVESIDGAAFMIDLLDLHPLATTQAGRIQGEGGGRR